MKGLVSIYLRLIDFQAKALTSNGTFDDQIGPVTNILDKGNAQFIKISSCNSDIEQTLNIGSQSTGAGAGKITFNPFKITKFIDAISPALFLNAASGTPFKTAEVFLSAKRMLFRLFKLISL